MLASGFPYLVFEGSRARPLGLVAFVFSWGLAGAVDVVMDMGAGDDAGFKCVLLCLPIKMQIAILNSVKNKSVRRICRKSL